MPDMIAAKGFTYGTRRLKADEPFTARSKDDARLLQALGRARYATAEGRADDAEPPKPAAAPKPPSAPRTHRKPVKD